MDLMEKQLSREKIYAGPVFTVTRDEILLPDGRINDAKTLAVLLRAGYRMKGEV